MTVGDDDWLEDDLGGGGGGGRKRKRPPSDLPSRREARRSVGDFEAEEEEEEAGGGGGSSSQKENVSPNSSGLAGGWDLDPDTQSDKQLVLRLVDIIKSSPGLGPRGGASHVVVTLTHQCPRDLQPTLVPCT